MRKSRTQRDRDLYSQEIKERRPVKLVSKAFKKPGGVDGFMSDLETLRKKADSCRTSSGRKLNRRERQHLFMTGELPGSATR